VWDDYIAISNALPGWEARLEAFGVRTLMLSPEEHAALVAAAGVSPHWKQVYQDAAAVIFVQNP
jgi:hypothetical protein